MIILSKFLEVQGRSGWIVSKSPIHTLLNRAKNAHFLSFGQKTPLFARISLFREKFGKNEFFKYREAIFYLVEIFIIFFVVASLRAKTELLHK